MDYIDITFSTIIAISLAYIIYDYAIKKIISYYPTKEKIEGFGVPLWVWASVSAIILFIILVGWVIYFYLKVSLTEGLKEINYIIIALIAFIGSPFFIWRTMLTNKQTENAQRQTQIQQESEYTKNYFEAIQQLDFKADDYDEKITSRAGAIYELGKIAKNSKDHHLQIIKLLESYIRKNAKKEEPKKEDKIDIIAILVVVGNRNEKWIEEIEDKENYELNFNDLDLSRIQLPPNMNFANTSFLDAKLQRTGLQGATLQGASLQGANLQGANLQGANLQGVNLRVTDLQDARLQDERLQEERLHRARLREERFRVEKLEEERLREERLQEERLQEERLHRTRLREARLREERLQEERLQEERLHRARLREARLQREARFQEARFQRARLHRTRPQVSNFQDAKLDLADLCRANLSNAKNLTQEQIDSAFGDGATQLPEGLNKPSHWPTIRLNSTRGYEEWNKWREDYDNYEPPTE